MGKYADRACELFLGGANCAQSVFAAFSEPLGLDEEFCLKISSAFGGGMGRMREVCGAVSGMLMVAGLLRGYAQHNDTDKKAIYELTQSMAERFKKAHGTIICRELLKLPSSLPESPEPTKRDEKFYKDRPCIRFVETAALLAEELLDNSPNNDI